MRPRGRGLADGAVEQVLDEIDEFFEEGLLVFPLDGPLDEKMALHASARPVLTEDHEGWHPATRKRGAAMRWSFVNRDWTTQFRGQQDGRRSLPTMAKAFLAGRCASVS